MPLSEKIWNRTALGVRHGDAFPPEIIEADVPAPGVDKVTAMSSLATNLGGVLRDTPPHLS